MVQDFQNLALHVAHKFFQLLIKNGNLWICQAIRNTHDTKFPQGALYIEMTKCKASPRRQCLQLLFITHLVIIGDKIFTTTSQTTQVCNFAMPCFDDYNIKQYLIESSMHPRITKPSLQTNSLEIHKFMYIHLVFFFFKVQNFENLLFAKKIDLQNR